MKKIISQGVMMLIIGTLGQAAQATLIYSNTFQNGQDKTWVESQGKWSWNDKGLTSASPGENRIFLDLLKNVDLSQGYQVNFTADLIAGKGWGFFFNSGVDSSKNVSGFNFQYDTGYGSGAYLIRNWNKNKEGVLKQVNTSTLDNNAHLFTVNISPKSVTVFQDSREILSYTGILDPAGSQLGFRTWGNTTAVFSDFSVSGHSVPEPGSLALLILGSLGMTRKFMKTRSNR